LKIFIPFDFKKYPQKSHSFNLPEKLFVFFKKSRPFWGKIKFYKDCSQGEENSVLGLFNVKKKQK